jgi:hypothetical protein
MVRKFSVISPKVRTKNAPRTNGLRTYGPFFVLCAVLLVQEDKK